MSDIKIDLIDNISNVSLQIGDVAYFVTPTVHDPVLGINYPQGFKVQADDMKEIGKITKVGANFVTVENPINIPSPNDFIMFSKSKLANNSSLIGYYAEVKLNNNSTEKIELFSLGSEVSPSSK